MGVNVANCQIFDIVSSVELLKSFDRNFESEISFKQHASLPKIVPAPLLQEVSVQHASAKVSADLVTRVVPAVVNAIVSKVSPLLIPSEGLVNSLRLKSQLFPDLAPRLLLLELEINDLSHLEGVDLVINSCTFLLFFTLPLL